MLYNRIDIRKLYEQADVAYSQEEGQAGEFPTEKEASADAINQLKRGSAYGFPISQEINDQLFNLIDSGSGEWMSTEPLKTLESGRDGEPAMMTFGDKTLPVYLMIKLHSSKGNRKAEVLNLELEDYFHKKCELI